MEQSLLAVAGVRDVSIEIETGRAAVVLDAKSPPTSAQLARAVEQGGFTVDHVDMPR